MPEHLTPPHRAGASQPVQCVFGTDKAHLWHRQLCSGSGKEQVEVWEARIELLVLGAAPSASFGSRQRN